jgi:hypothetical protein
MHEWKVKPDMFYQMPCQYFVSEIVEGKIQVLIIDLVVVDPPWNKEKRGLPSIPVAIAKMPYHMYVNSAYIIHTGVRLARHLNTLLLYRYRERLECKHLISINAEVKFFEKKGYVYYGVCKV